MRKSAKKLLSGVLAGLMVVSMAPISAMAADYNPGDVVNAADYLSALMLLPRSILFGLLTLIEQELHHQR